MQPRVLSILCFAMLPAGALAAPGDTAGASERDRADSNAREELQEPRRRTPPAGTVAADQEAPGQSAESATAELVATDELIGRNVVTQEGERLGTLRFVTVSLDRGNISHLVIDTSGTDFESSQNAGTGTPQQDPTTGQRSDTTQAPDTTAAAPGTPEVPRTPDQAPGTPQSPQTAQAPASTGQPGEQSQPNLLIVPWSVADLNTSGDNIVVAATGRHIASAPRLKREELNRLTEPALASYVIDYWAPASELAALEGRRNQPEEPARQPQQPQQPQIEKNRQSETPQSPDNPEAGSPDQAGTGALNTRPGYGDDASSSTPAVGSLATSAAGTPGSSADSRTARDADLQDSRVAGATGSSQGASQSAAGASDRTAGASGSSSNQIVLVGQEVVAAVTPPMFQLSKQLRGAKVIDRNGSEVGEIRQIVIDASTGDAAFAVIEGTSAGRAPVPLQALDWAAEGTTTLTADSSKLQSNEALTGQSGKVDRNELAKLYQRFDTEPYWQAAVTPGTQGTPQSPQNEPGALPQ